MLIKKVIRRIIIAYLLSKGFNDWGAYTLFDELYNDFCNTKVSLRRKIWAYKHGYLSSRIFEYKLNDYNLNDYVNDFDYYKSYPLNNEYKMWIDDKVSYKYVLQPFNEYLPKYYFELHKGLILKLMDCPDSYLPDTESIIDLLRSEKFLAAKITNGSGGIGFHKLSLMNDTIYVNNEIMKKDNFKSFIDELDNVIITEYLIAHHSIRKIYDKTPNALRVTTVRDEKNNTHIIGSFIRFGTNKTGNVDNVFAGGIMCGVHLNDGTLYSPKIREGCELIDITSHPDTNVEIRGNIPYWDLIVDKIKEIGNYIPQLRYMGFDVIITEDSFKIIEINSHSCPYVIQVYYPLRKNKAFMDLLNKRPADSSSLSDGLDD